MRFLSIDHLSVNRRRLSDALGIKAELDDELAYRLAVGSIRGFPADETGIRVSFEDEAPARFIQRSGYFDDIFAHVRASTPEERGEVPEAIHGSLLFIDRADPLLGDLIRLSVTDVAIMPADRIGGGSGSHFPGLVCVSPSPEWSSSEVSETLIHEAAHLTAFICEMLHPFYTRSLTELESPSVRVVSAVRIGEKRPLDKALHSALVAVPLMYFQHLLGNTALVDLFSNSIKDCAEGLSERREYFTDYGWAVVTDLREFTDSLDFNLVYEGLRRSDAQCL